MNNVSSTAAFFDLDHTLLSANSEQSFGAFMLRKGKLSFWQFLSVIYWQFRYKVGLLPHYHQAKSRVIHRLFCGKSIAEIQGLLRDSFEVTLRKKIYSEMRQVMDLHRQRGDRIFIITSSLDFIAKEYAAHLGVEHVYATTLERSSQQFTGRVIGTFPYGEGKATIVQNIVQKEKIDLGQSYAYGDHFSDRFMLQMVGHPVAVNPDKKLLQLAKEKQWQVLLPIS